jgi:hypothetical protein
MVDDDLRGRFLAQAFWTELEKIANITSPQMLPMQQMGKNDEENVEIDQFEDDDKVSPVVGIIGTKIEKKDKKVRATPIHNPPPGYIYDPDKASFVPNLNIPGWMSADQQALAAAKQDGYAEAKREDMIRKSEQEADKFVELRATPPEVPAPGSTPPVPPGIMGPPQPPAQAPPIQPNPQLQ